MTTLESNYNQSVMDIIECFEFKHEVSFDGWVGNDVGEVAEFNGCFFNFDDVKRDIFKDAPLNCIWDWYYGHYTNPYGTCNYQSYLSGYRVPEPTKLQVFKYNFKQFFRFFISDIKVSIFMRTKEGKEFRDKFQDQVMGYRQPKKKKWYQIK
jgi:hypothetical protein